jgi:hypothetical protein
MVRAGWASTGAWECAFPDRQMPAADVPAGQCRPGSRDCTLPRCALAGSRSTISLSRRPSRRARPWRPCWSRPAWRRPEQTDRQTNDETDKSRSGAAGQHASPDCRTNATRWTDIQGKRTGQPHPPPPGPHLSTSRTPWTLRGERPGGDHSGPQRDTGGTTEVLRERAHLAQQLQAVHLPRAAPEIRDRLGLPAAAALFCRHLGDRRTPRSV